MYKHLAESLATLLAANRTIDIDRQECYSYGLELFLFKFTLYIIILIISLITNTFLISLIFTVSYLLLRQYTGGYHCKTAEACMITSIFIYALMLLLYNVGICNYSVYLLICNLPSYLVILIRTPIENENNPLEISEIKAYRIISIIVSSILIVLCVVLHLLSLNNYIFPISFAMTADAVLILITPRRKKNEKGNS